MYKIKSLEWKRLEAEINESEDIQDLYAVIVPFGFYKIELIGSKWFVIYSFQEYYDDGCIDECFSLKEAKEIATKHWKKRLIQALEII